MNKLSIVMPFANEHPQAAFTIQNIEAELEAASVDYEIMCIDNFCDELAAQGPQDPGGAYLEKLCQNNPRRKYLRYQEKLSHWNAKNAGVQASSGDILWFVAAHCLLYPGSLVRMFDCYRRWREYINGTLHMPITYMLDDPNAKLIYKPVIDLDCGIAHYSFTKLNMPDHPEIPMNVPCMSTCGMMMSREIYDLMGGWPTELGIYGGGENFLNYALACLDKTVNIYPQAQLFHYAAPRGYHWNFYDFHRNRCIASFMYGGKEMASTYMANVEKGSRSVLDSILTEVCRNKTCQSHRNLIAQRAVTTIEAWVKAHNL